MNAWWTKYLPDILKERLEGRHSFQQVIGNTGWMLVDRILRMVTGLLVGIWVTRYLGPGRFGLFSYTLAFVALLSPLVSLGLEDIVVRNIVRNPSCKDETLGTAFVLKLIGGMASFAIAIGSIIVLHKGDSQIQWLVGIIAAGNIFQSFSVIEYWFNSQVKAKYAVFAKSAAFFICSAIKIALIIHGASLAAFAWVGTFEMALGSICLLVVYASKGDSIQNWRVSLQSAANLLKDSWPLALSIAAMTIYERIDQVMLGEMVGSEEVGIYSVAVRLAEVWIFIPVAIHWSVFPSIVRSKSLSDDIFYSQIQKFYNLMALLGYTIAIPTTILAHWLVIFLYGKEFAKAGLMLSILIWASIFTNLEVARSSFLTTMNWTKAYFVTVLSGALLNIALNFMLIPRYGGVGAATSSLIAYWFAVHGSCFLFKPLFRTGSMMTRAMLYPKIW
jgi:O-antigen/teichoic acid export membrane protein